MIRFLEGLLCGLLVEFVGLEKLCNATIQVGEAVMTVIQHFS